MQHAFRHTLEQYRLRFSFPSSIDAVATFSIVAMPSLLGHFHFLPTHTLFVGKFLLLHPASNIYRSSISRRGGVLPNVFGHNDITFEASCSHESSCIFGYVRIGVLPSVGKSLLTAAPE